MTEGCGRAAADHARNSKAPTLLPRRAEQMRWALADPVSFRCHQAPLDRPLTVGMVVDAPHTPGRVISGDRVVAPSGMVPALVVGVCPRCRGHSLERLTRSLRMRPSVSARRCLRQRLPGTGLYQGWCLYAIRPGPLLGTCSYETRPPPASAIPGRRHVPSPGQRHPLGQPDEDEQPDRHDRQCDDAGQDPIGPQIGTRKGHQRPKVTCPPGDSPQRVPGSRLGRLHCMP